MQAPGQVQQGSGEGSEGSNCLGTFGAEPGQVQQRSGGLYGAEPARFNRVPTKVPEKIPGPKLSGSTGSVEGSGEGLGSFGAEPGQVQQGS